MVTDLAVDVNALTFIVAEAMYIDLLPEERLSTALLPASKQPALTYLAGLGRSSQRPMWLALRMIAAILSAGELNPLTLPWHELSRAHLNAVRAKLIDRYSVATGQRMMAALRGTMKECWRLDLMTTEAYHKAIDIKPIKGSGTEQAAGRALSAGEIVAILQVCRVDTGPAGPRDAAILGVGVRCGLRRSEIANLQLADYDPERRSLTVHHGKGNKARTVYVGPGTDEALAEWIDVRGQHDGPLFLAINKGERITTKGLSDAAIYKALAKRGHAAGVRKFSPHDLRRTFAGDMLDAGADISTVQKLMGHANVSTTAGYDRRGERAKQEAAGRLHLPWQRRK